MDGRRARAARTREAIVVSALALIDAGELRPTAATIAARAGLSVRSVFQHFTDLEDLFVAVADRHVDRIASLYTGAVYEGDLASRIDAFVDHRARLYEAIAPIRRAAILQEPFSPVIASRLELARTLHRLDLERAFGDELRGTASGDDSLREALSAVTGFVVWDEMRRRSALDVPAACAAMRRAVTGLLAPAQAGAPS